MRIVVALDAGKDAEVVLGPAARLARETGADVVLVSVLDPMVDAADVVAASRSEAMREVVAAREAYLEQFAGQFGDRPATMIAEQLRHGEDVPSGIARVCREQGADMLVLASRRSSGIEGFILGSAAQELLRVAPCPVLLVRPQ